jgi:hypothetical protein
MLEASAERIRAELIEDDVVLDIGGGAQPFSRADWVMDWLPHEARAGLGHRGGASERFTRATWIRRDICDREPYPFADKQVDFVICSHTLEDVRDPCFVCSEMVRIAKRGYIEVPSRLEEQTYGFQGPWTGWSHHRWLVDVGESRIDFAYKPHLINGRTRDRFPPEFLMTLSPEERVQTLWWSDAFDFAERVFHGAADLDAYTSGYVREQLALRRFRRPGPLRRALWRLRRPAFG